MRVDYESMLVQDLLNAEARGELDLRPWYQRRSVWSDAHKSYLVNTVFNEMPVPTLYLRHRLDLERELTIKEVVDGQQRCTALIDYRRDAFTAKHPNHSRRVKYSELSSSEKGQFLMSKLSVAQLISADDRDVIEIFGRLNAASKTLNAQEKRAAQYSGEFHQFCLSQASLRLPFWREMKIFTATEISRMQEVQFLADLTLSMMDGLVDQSAAKITAAYKKWDADFPEHNSLEHRFERVFEHLTSVPETAIRDTIFSRSPLFYSLFYVLDTLDRLPRATVTTEALHEMDARFNDPRPPAERPTEDVQFESASTSTTQRIRQRRVRDAYIRSFLHA